jgi:hypothetical protein
LSPVSANDPKHGRWILPLVVLGLIVFTYWFVNALPEGTVATATTTTLAGEGTSTTTADDATTTTLPSGVAEFVTLVDGLSTRVSDLAAESQTINDDFDADTAVFGETRDAMRDLETEVATLASEISTAHVPEAAVVAWDDVISVSAAMANAAAEMFDGLVNTEGSAKRLEWSGTLQETATQLVTSLANAKAAVTGES